MKSKVLALLLAGTCVVATGCGKKPEENNAYKEDAYITINVNPAIELLTNSNGELTKVSGLNNEAKVLLAGLNFQGKTVEQATKEIITLLDKLGYLDAVKNEFLFTTESNDKAELDKVLSELVGKSETELSKDLEYKNAEEVAAEELKTEAASLGITVGKLELINTILTYDKTLDKNTLKNNSLKSLNERLEDLRDEREDLLTEELEREYDALKNSGEFLEEKTEIITMIDLALAKTDAEIATVLKTTEANATAIRALLLTLKEDINTDPNVTGTVNETEKAKLNAKLAELETAYAELEELDETAANYDEEEERIEEEIETLEKELEALIENQSYATISAFADEAIVKTEEKIATAKTALFALEKTDADYEAKKEGLEDKIDNLNDIIDELDDYLDDANDPEELLENLYETLEDSLEDNYDIDLEDLEDHFETAIDAAVKAIETQNDADLKAFLDQASADYEATLAKLKAEKEALEKLNIDD